MWYREWDDQPIGETEEEAFETMREEMSFDDLLDIMLLSLDTYEVLSWLARDHSDLFFEHFEREISEAETEYFEINAYERDNEEEEEE